MLPSKAIRNEKIMDTLMLQANLGTFREREIDRKYLDALENLKKKKPDTDTDTWAASTDCKKMLTATTTKFKTLKATRVTRSTPTKHEFYIFLNIHLGYSFNDIVLIRLSPFCRGIPLPGSGIVGINWSAHCKTTVRSNSVRLLSKDQIQRYIFCITLISHI